MAQPTGTIFAEIGIDFEPATKAQKQLLQDATQTSLNIERNFKNLGIKSSAEFDLMRTKITNSYNMIANSHKATANDILRAEQAKNAQLTRLNEQQFGQQTTMLTALRGHYMAATAAIAISIAAVTAAWKLAKIGAEFEEQRGILTNLSRKYKTTADEIVASMERASEGMIAKTDLMKVALGGIAKGLSPDQLTNLADAAKIFGDYAGGATEALKDLTESLETGRTRTLKQYLGTTLDLKTAFGDLESKMTAVEKANAMYNIIMMEATRRQGEMKAEVDDSADKLERLEAKYKNVTLAAGNFWKTVVVGVTDYIAAIGKGAAAAAGGEAGGIDLPDTGTGTAETTKDKSQTIIDGYKKQIEELKKLLSARKTGDDAAKTAEREREHATKRIVEDMRKQAVEIDGYGKSQYEKDLIRMQSEAEEFRKKGVDKIKIASWVAKETTVINQKHDDEARKALSSYVEWERKQIEDLVEYQRTQGGKRVSISASLWDKIAQYETMTGTTLAPAQRNEIDVNALMEEYWGMSYEMAAFYSTIEGYEDEYRNHVFDWIDKEEKRLAAFYDDDVAAAKWAADEKGKIEYDLFKKKTDYIAQGFGQLQNSFEAMADIYADGSADAKRWEEAAKAMEIAQRGVAVVQAVAAIATQGLGDPYTAFARVAAMTATMISLLASIGESVNGSSTTASSYSIATSSATTLGSEEGSKSVSNSLAMLQDTYDMEYRELSGIYEEMKDLNDNITGLVTSLVQTGGVSQFASLSEESLSGIAGFYESLWGSLGSWFGNFFGGIASSLFGGKTSYELSGAGVSVYGKSISDLLEGASVYGEYYNTVKKTKSGGLFGKDKISYQTYYEAMSGDTLNMFTLVYKNLSETMLEIAAGLGTDMSKTLAYTFSGFTVELKDLSTDQITEAISSAISAVGDTAASALFGDILKQYQQLNEGLLETAVRIIQDKAVIEYWLDKTNQAFEGTTTEAIAFSEALIDIAGSLEDLTDAMETYYDKFFTDAEQQAKLQEDLISSLGAYGYDLPGTRTGYRSIVESLDITTDAGQAAYVALMQMAESADQYYSYLEDLASSRSESDYSSRLDYLRAISGFAEGGISSGPDSGYLAQLHGTELIISPKNGYPAKVVGADSPELLAEIRLLRQEVTELKSYNKTTSNVLQRVTRGGDSMLTEAV